MQKTLRILEGDGTSHLIVLTNHRIRNIRKEIWRLSGVPPFNQKLVFRGCEIQGLVRNGSCDFALPTSPFEHLELPSVDDGDVLHLIEEHRSQGNSLHLSFSGSTQKTEKELEEAVRVLIEKGENIDEMDIFQQTALHLAATCQDERMLEDLLGVGADWDQKDMNGKSPIERTLKKKTLQALLCGGAEGNSSMNLGAFDFRCLQRIAAFNEWDECIIESGAVSHLFGQKNSNKSIIEDFFRRYPSRINYFEFI